ncbi:unnamed protein product [Pedinophyceae sp. YPF-701]|nr:unnamed protein product [Pedinophyceae sp. YPF-701]
MRARCQSSTRGAQQGHISLGTGRPNRIPRRGVCSRANDFAVKHGSGLLHSATSNAASADTRVNALRGRKSLGANDVSAGSVERPPAEARPGLRWSDKCLMDADGTNNGVLRRPGGPSEVLPCFAASTVQARDSPALLSTPGTGTRDVIVFALGALTAAAAVLAVVRGAVSKPGAADDREEPRPKAASTGEPVEWINMSWRKLWRVYLLGLEGWLMGRLQTVFDWVVRDFAPKWIRGVKVAKFTLDHEPPLFSDMRRRISRRDSDLCGVVDVRYTGGAKMLLVVEVGAESGAYRIKLPIMVSDLDVQGKLWIKLRLAPMPPWIGTISIAFVEPPNIRVQLSPYNRIRLMRIPVIQTYLRKLITVDLPGLMVLPRRLQISLPPSLTSVAEAAVGRDTVIRAIASAVLQADALETALLAALPLGPQAAAGGVSLPESFTGELTVMLVEGRNLPVWGLPWQTNPYCSIRLGTQVACSKRNADTTVDRPGRNPTWNQEFQFLVEDPMAQSLEIEVLDSPLTGRTIVGNASLPLKDLVTEPTKRVWVPLGPSRPGQASRGDLRLEVSYEAFDDDDEERDSAYRAAQLSQAIQLQVEQIKDVRSAAQASSQAGAAAAAAVSAVAATKAAAARAAARAIVVADADTEPEEARFGDGAAQMSVEFAREVERAGLASRDDDDDVGPTGEQGTPREGGIRDGGVIAANPCGDELKRLPLSSEEMQTSADAFADVFRPRAGSVRPDERDESDLEEDGIQELLELKQESEQAAEEGSSAIVLTDQTRAERDSFEAHDSVVASGRHEGVQEVHHANGSPAHVPSRVAQAEATSETCEGEPLAQARMMSQVSRLRQRPDTTKHDEARPGRFSKWARFWRRRGGRSSTTSSIREPVNGSSGEHNAGERGGTSRLNADRRSPKTVSELPEVPEVPVEQVMEEVSERASAVSSLRPGPVCTCR